MLGGGAAGEAAVNDHGGWRSLPSPQKPLDKPANPIYSGLKKSTPAKVTRKRSTSQEPGREGGPPAERRPGESVMEGGFRTERANRRRRARRESRGEQPQYRIPSSSLRLGPVTGPGEPVFPAESKVVPRAIRPLPFPKRRAAEGFFSL